MNSTNKKYDIKDLTENEWLRHSLYTVSDRALPSIVDGFKPSQRYAVYSTIKDAKTSFEKIDSISSNSSKFGYAHGATSIASAMQLMCADWYTNERILEGRGSFGSRLIQVPASPRYVYAKMHKNFEKYFKDIGMEPPHEDPEISIPKYYLPVIPMVLVNGTSGMATGFACNIFGREVSDVIKATSEYVSTGKITTKIRYKFPNFNGKIELEDDGKVSTYGVYKRVGLTEVLITEVPYMSNKSRYDRESYVSILDKLEEDDKISSYDDLCNKDGFSFKIRLKRGIEYTDDMIIDMFKLKTSLTENLTVIMPNNRPKKYDNAEQLIADFCEIRKPFFQKRIDETILSLSEENRVKRVKMFFIIAVLDGKVTFKDKKKADVAKMIMDNVKNVVDTDVDYLLRINLMSLTEESVKSLANDILENKKELDYWKATTATEQFVKDLSSM